MFFDKAILISTAISVVIMTSVGATPKPQFSPASLKYPPPEDVEWLEKKTGFNIKSINWEKTCKNIKPMTENDEHGFCKWVHPAEAGSRSYYTPLPAFGGGTILRDCPIDKERFKYLSTPLKQYKKHPWEHCEIQFLHGLLSRVTSENTFSFSSYQDKLTAKQFIAKYLKVK